MKQWWAAKHRWGRGRKWPPDPSKFRGRDKRWSWESFDVKSSFKRTHYSRLEDIKQSFFPGCVVKQVEWRAVAQGDDGYYEIIFWWAWTRRVRRVFLATVWFDDQPQEDFPGEVTPKLFELSIMASFFPWCCSFSCFTIKKRIKHVLKVENWLMFSVSWWLIFMSALCLMNWETALEAHERGEKERLWYLSGKSLCHYLTLGLMQYFHFRYNTNISALNIGQYQY